MDGKGIGGHQRAYKGRSDEWLTPPHVLEALGSFDLDPCSPIVRPWPTATKHYTIEDDGLVQPWEGRVWLNPPYGPETEKWLAKMARHGDGVALIFARTETEMFHEHCWKAADSMLFLRGRLYFHRADGTRAKANAGGPSVLIAYGRASSETLSSCGLPGQFIELKGGSDGP
jgi:hypothetical protein